MFQWFDLIGANHFIGLIRASASPYVNLLPKVVVYCLPNGLWVYAFTVIMGLVWINGTKLEQVS